MSEQSASAGVIVVGKVGALALAIVAIGLPINDLTDYAILLTAAVVVFVGAVKPLRSRWLAAAALAVAVAAGHMLLPAPRIEEAHNVFLPGPDAAKTSGLPRAVFDVLDRQFAEQYPPEKRCDDPARGCWRPQRSRAQDGFALSNDALFDRGAWSRRVTGIHFADPVHAHLGVVNEIIYNWTPDTSDILRFDRDRRSFNLFDRYHLTFPIYIMYRFPADFAGSTLCWRGDVMWEKTNEEFELLSHRDMGCRTITAADANRRVVALAIKLDHPLAMTLTPNWTVWLRGLFATGLTIVGVVGILGLLVRIDPRRLLWPAVLVGSGLLVITLMDVNFIGGLRPLDGGDDGMTYDGYARDIIHALIAGDIANALRGDESVFYFSPGLRYLRALEHIVFGETYFGYLSLVLALPFLVFALFRRFLPERWARVIVIGFVLTPLGALFGSAFLYYVKWAARGFADPCGYILLLAGMVALIPRAEEADDPPAWPAFAGAMLMAIGTFVRPNVALASGVMALGAFILAVQHRRFARAAAAFGGYAVLLVSPLHNWIFGHSLVPFATSVSLPTTLVMPPTAYFAAAYDILHLDLASDHVIAAIKKLAWWLSGPANVYAMIPLNGAAVATLVRVGFFGARFDPWLRLVALATLLEHGTGVCYANWDRYHLVTWLLTALVAIVWLRVEGLPWLDRASPGLRKRIAPQAAISRAASGLARVS